MTVVSVEPIAIAIIFSWAFSSLTYAQSSDALYERDIRQYPVPILQSIGSREYKIVLDASQLQPVPKDGLAKLWAVLKTEAGIHSILMLENPLKSSSSLKVYYDTPDLALRRKGYLIRVTTVEKHGLPRKDKRTVTIKAIHPNAAIALATPLKIADRAAKISAEENVGIGPSCSLQGAIAKETSFSIEADVLGSGTLADFGRFMPELLELGLPAETHLKAAKAYSINMRPGVLALEISQSNTIWAKISLESWSSEPDGPAFLYEVSFRSRTKDFYADGPLHARGEGIAQKLFCGALARITVPGDAASKAQNLMSRD